MSTILEKAGTVIKLENNDLVILQSDKDKCRGEDARDCIDVICHIMGMWQVEALKLYNRSLRPESKYYVFIYLYIDAIKKEKEGNIGIKNRLDMVIKRIGNPTIEEVGEMMAYRRMRNSISHKKKWDIEKVKNGRKDGVKNKKTYDDVLERFREATGGDAYIYVEKKDVLYSALRTI
ncbi:unnamed protein product [Rhizophagus irregularis]|uniref:Uncharacterized protein n=1 Tax=Rhizophagus irregularis TaxID=588596 RepID=A0A916E1X7_9GLOM|nr:unnamed protein product [Rhizophagus irregularis]